ncbi:uncharacterized protein LOC117299802 [Asterias rubens]|uniref:uncharacterized protein LOC117299802 n=1 Tax=Asterias rubens TaxID=7604 RepID=UPI00145535F3|nr:uncharacterized protein LOC117299802 [Asterias rubens]
MTTMLITALLMVTVFVSSSYCEAYSCCPKCSTESINQFNYLQLQQIVSQRSVIEEIEQDPQLLYNATYQRSFVTLTKQQNQEILRNFPEIFRDRESFLNTSSTVGTVSQSPAGDGRTRRSVSQLVCPPILGSQPLIIARKPNGDVVELVQMSGQGMNQWILEETCQFPNDPTLTHLRCCLVERHVIALFINLSQLSQGLSANDFDFADIVVQCCATFRD